MKNELTDLSVRELIDGLKKRKFSIRQIIEQFLDNIENYEDQLHAFTVKPQKEKIIKNKENLPLSGIPFSMKDVYITSGLQTTAGSKVLDGYKPQYNATVYTKLLDAGAILLGKNTQDAWGHGSTSENTDYGIPKNPWDTKRVAGGSSGGSAAAVAARMVAFAIGQDTGGSIRNPASFCNITGLKVTYGRVSRYGAIAYASSLDTVGPMAKSVEDIAIILSVIAGKDPYDGTSSSVPVPDYTKELKKGIKGKRIGIPKEFFQEGTDKEVINKTKEVIKIFEDLGAKSLEVSIPSIDSGVAAYYLLAPCETSSNLARYDGIRYGYKRDRFTQETMRRIMTGIYALSSGYYDAYYKKSLKVRTMIINDYQKVFQKCDMLLGPVTPKPAPKLGELISDPIQLMLSDIYTLTQNIAGIPSLAFPCGFSKLGLPIGVQLMGKMFDEQILLQAGYAYQQVTNWHKQKPKL